LAPAPARLDRFSDREGSDEADLPAKTPEAEEDAWLPGADEDEGRAPGAQEPKGEGTQTADRLTGRFPRRERLAGGADFQAVFRKGRRVESPSLVLLWSEGDQARRVGFAVGRQVRGSVRRNRARRRLREAYRAARAAAPSTGALVAIARARALEESFGKLVAEMRTALASVPGPRTPA
jgi:ribonuclease P protein component